MTEREVILLGMNLKNQFPELIGHSHFTIRKEPLVLAAILSVRF